MKLVVGIDTFPRYGNGTHSFTSVRFALFIWWLAPLALSFPSNQPQSTGRYGGIDNIRATSQGDICSVKMLFSAPKSIHEATSVRQQDSIMSTQVREADRWRAMEELLIGLINSIVIRRVCLPVPVLLRYVSVCLPSSIPTYQSMSVWLSCSHCSFLLFPSVSLSLLLCLLSFTLVNNWCLPVQW